MTAPTTHAPTADGGGAEAAGQAPANSTTSPAGPGESSPAGNPAGTPANPAGTPVGNPAGGGQGDGPRGRRAPGEHVRSASRDDLEPQEPETGDDKAGDDKADGKKAGDWRIEDLPPGAQKLIGDLRKENGTRRTEAAEAKKAREEAEKKAAAGDDRFASATEAFMRALGLTPEPDEPQRSPEQQLAEATTNYRNTRVELAVFRAAGSHGADPEALLDSRAFLTRAHALDPSAEDFDSAIAAAIGDAVDGNPKLRAEAPARPVQQAPSGGDFGGGPAGPPGPEDWSVDDFRRARRG